MFLLDSTITSQRLRQAGKKALAITILIGTGIGWLGACTEEKAPFMQNSGRESQTLNYRMYIASDSGILESESENASNLYGVAFPKSGFFTVKTGDEILTIAISVFTKKNKLAEVLCRSQSQAFIIFHDVLERCTCDELLDPDAETLDSIKRSLIQALENYHTWRTSGKEDEITDIAFEVESCG